MAFDLKKIYLTYPNVIAKMPRRQPMQSFDFDSHDFIREWSHDNQNLYIAALSAQEGSNPFMIIHGLLVQGLNEFPNLVAQAGETKSADVFGRMTPCMAWKRVTGVDANEPNISVGKTLEFYLSFDYLDAGDFAALLSDCNKLFGRIANSIGRHKGERPALIIERISTGESVRFKFTERWLPNVRSHNTGDVVLEMPKPLGVLILMAYLILNATKEIVAIRNEYLDSEIKKIELELKKHELMQRMDDHTLQELRFKANIFVINLAENKLFRDIVIDSTPIKVKGVTSFKKVSLLKTELEEQVKLLKSKIYYLELEQTKEETKNEEKGSGAGQ